MSELEDLVRQLAATSNLGNATAVQGSSSWNDGTNNQISIGQQPNTNYEIDLGQDPNQIRLIGLGNGAGQIILGRESPAYTATYQPDPSLGPVKFMTLTGNVSVVNPVSGSQGYQLIFFWTQDASGSRTVTYDSNWYKVGGAPAFSTTASTVTIDSFFSPDGIIWRLVSRITGQA
jgi:hypothetical protein